MMADGKSQMCLLLLCRWTPEVVGAGVADCENSVTHDVRSYTTMDKIRMIVPIEHTDRIKRLYRIPNTEY